MHLKAYAQKLNKGRDLYLPRGFCNKIAGDLNDAPQKISALGGELAGC